MAEYVKKEVELKEVKEVKKVEVKKPNPTQFKMVKNFGGGMGVSLDSYDFSTPMRTINFKHNQEFQHIPAKYALGVFVTNSAFKQFEDGYFTFENLDVLIEMAEELGYFVPDSIKEPKLSLNDIKKTLVAADISAIDRMLLNASTKNITDLLLVASRIYSGLNMNVVQHIEKKYKVSLAPVGDNA